MKDFYGTSKMMNLLTNEYGQKVASHHFAVRGVFETNSAS